MITDLAIEFLRDRPKDRPFFLMCHHKAPHRNWVPDEKHRRMFEGRTIPEPPTLHDDYATRTDALHENKQRVADDLTRLDLKLVPPAGLEGAARQTWLAEKPTEVTLVRDGKPETLRGAALAAWKYQRYMQDYLACVQSVDDNVGRLLDYLNESGLREEHDRHLHVATRASSSATTAVRQAVHVRGVAAHAVPRPLAGRRASRARPPTRWCSTSTSRRRSSTPRARPCPPRMQGRSLVPLLRGETPADWRTAMYYRYYHDPGHHDTRAHYGVRTRPTS